MGYLNVDPKSLGSTADYRERGFDIAPQAGSTPGMGPSKNVVTRGLPANLRVDAGLGRGRSTAFDISPQATATPGPWDRVTRGLPVNLRLDAGLGHLSPYERRLRAESGGLGCDCIGPVRPNLSGGADFGKHFAIPGPLGQPTAMAVYEGSAQRDPSLVYLTPTGNTSSAHAAVRMGSAAQAGVRAVGQGPGNGVGYAQRKGSGYVPITTEAVPSYARRRLRLGSGMGKDQKGPAAPRPDLDETARRDQMESLVRQVAYQAEMMQAQIPTSTAETFVSPSFPRSRRAPPVMTRANKGDIWQKKFNRGVRKGEIVPTVTPAGAVESDTPVYETTEWGMFGMGSLFGLSGIAFDNLSRDINAVDADARALGRVSASGTSGEYQQTQNNEILDRLVPILNMIRAAVERGQLTESEAEILRNRVTQVRSVLSGKSSTAWGQSAGGRTLVEKVGGVTSAFGITDPGSARDVKAMNDAKQAMDMGLCAQLTKGVGFNVCRWGPIALGGMAFLWLFGPRIAQSMGAAVGSAWRHSNPVRKYSPKRRAAVTI